MDLTVHIASLQLTTRRESGPTSIHLSRVADSMVRLVITLLDPDDKVEQHSNEESGADERWADEVVKVARVFGLDERHTSLVAVQSPQQC